MSGSPGLRKIASRNAAASYSPSTPSPLSRSQTRPPRLVRRASLGQRLNDLPTSLMMALEEWLSLLDYRGLGYPAGAFLHLLSMFASYPALKSFPTTSARLTAATARQLPVDERMREMRLLRASRNRWIWWRMEFLGWILLIISIANALYLFTRRRKYTMYMRKDPLSSPNARQVEVDFRSSAKSFGSKAKSWFLEDILGCKSVVEDEQGTAIAQELRMWDPPNMPKRLFALYSPPISMMYRLLDKTNWGTIFLCIILLIVQTFLIMNAYSNLVQDKILLQSEVLHEYDQRFVYPRIFPSRADASTTTHSAEMITKRDWVTPISKADGLMQSQITPNVRAFHENQVMEAQAETNRKRNVLPEQRMPRNGRKSVGI